MQSPEKFPFKIKKIYIGGISRTDPFNATFQVKKDNNSFKIKQANYRQGFVNFKLQKENM